MTLKVASGFDNWANLADLITTAGVLLVARAPGPTPAVERRVLDQHRQVDAFTAALEYDDYLSAAALLSILQQLDLDEAESAELTLQLPGRLRDDEVWNVIIDRPSPRWERGRFEKTVFTVHLMDYLPSEFDTGFSAEFA